MAINTVLSTDYANRKIDLHIFQGVKAPTASSITPSFGRISNYCTGVQKLIQRYTIALLTELGSQPSFETFGTSLITELNSSSSLLNRADLYPIFNEANAKVLNEFFAFDLDNPSVPDDERLAGASVLSINSVNGTVSISVQIFTQATDPITFILPLPI